jgi:hypothetical protein
MNELIDLMVVEPEPDPTASLPPNYSPLDYFLAIMRDPRQPAWRRDRAAKDAAPYCHPRLAVTAITTPEGFAERLEAAIARSAQAKLIEAKPEPRSLPPTGPEPTPAGAPMARLRRL